jgi:hypothetical protein
MLFIDAGLFLLFSAACIGNKLRDKEIKPKNEKKK